MNQTSPTLSADLSPRLQRMRKRVIQARQEISIVRARALTEMMKTHPDLARSMQLALGLKETFRQLPISIEDDERIVGAMTEKFKGAVLNPELKSDHLIKELDNFDEREVARFEISEADKSELRNDILPFWYNNSAYDDWHSGLGSEELFYERNVAYVIANDFMGASNLSYIDYRQVLDQGLTAVLAQAAAAEARLPKDGPDVDKKRDFYQSVILSSEAVIEYADRYAHLAQEKAQRANSSELTQQMLGIVEITTRVPAHGARTFHEALQSLWFTYVALRQTDGGMETPLGRVDQLLGPYYRQDREAGRLSRSEALELVEEFFIKINQLAYLNEYAAVRIADGANQRPTVTLGGMDASGNDATNEVSFLLLEAADSLRLIYPNLAVRLHPAAPEAFWKRVTQLMTGGANIIEVFNDDVIISGFQQIGIPEERARDHIVTGCVEPIPSGTYGPTCSSYVNGPKVLELVLNGGKPILSLAGMSSLAADEGDAQDNPIPPFQSYEDLWEAYKTQARSVIASMDRGMHHVGDTMQRLLPNPLISALTEGTLENGRDVKAGGARYNIWGVNMIGLGTLADSLAALKELVFEKKMYSLPEVVEWLKVDFDGYEPQRQMLLNHAPKFGNDDPRVDAIAKEIVDLYFELLSPYRTYRNGVYTLGMHSETHHIIQGMAVAATPDGRHAGEMLSPGCGPTSGKDQNGPTASLHSMSAIDYTKVCAGASANMRFNPELLRTDTQAEQFEAMLKAYFSLGGQHLHVNVVDTQTLRDAQRHPEKYQDLIVRVAGYSARFIELTAGTQEEIIRRTEMAVC